MTTRAFVGIAMPEEICDVLEQLQDDLPMGRAMARDTLHLTLAFLGEQHDFTLAQLDEELSQVTATSFPLILRGIDTFGGDRPRVLWAGTEPEPALISLRNKVRRAAGRAGIELPRERFRPHVTLARFGRDHTEAEWHRLRGYLAHHAGFRAPPFEVTEFTLFASTLSPDGARHDPLQDYPLLPRQTA